MEHTAVHLEEYDDTDKLLRKAAYSTTMTYHFPRELRAMLEAAGLEVFHEQGSLHEDCPIGPGSTEMVFFAR